MDLVKIGAMSQVLHHFAQPETPMGLVYRKGFDLLEEGTRWPRPALIIPRGASVLRVRAGRKRFAVDATQVLWVPKGTAYDVEAESLLFDLMIMLPGDSFVREAVVENSLTPGEERAFQEEVFLRKRSRWLDDILDRYHFERVLNSATPLGCTFFLEKQITNELVRIFYPEKFLKYGQAIDAPESATGDVIRFIESSLFEELNLAALAKRGRVSVSTLIRKFKTDTGLTPHAYIKGRRLEEALRLLKTADHQVADVSTLVGYQDFTAFSKAFRARYGRPPSEFIPR